ncbi:hypothetical protein KJ616_00655 [Patescibacteria group bacterium]|nr:hypothetical protein [Patescibacteria group bacterium]
MKKIPQFLQKYFWDVDFSTVDKKQHSQFVIERILEYGDKKSIKWMKDNFSSEEIKKTLSVSKNLSRKSANFWQLIFGLDKDKILCLKKSFQKKHRAIWRY